MTNTIAVSFHGTELYIINHNGEPFTPMKPIVEGMGMDWMGQYTKLKQRFAKGIEEISIPTAGGVQKMLCLALRKLAAWLNTISPNKVRPEIRDRVIQYQEECDDVLYEYWTKGEVKRKSDATSVDDRTPLRSLVNRIMAKYGTTYQAVYKLIHREFGVNHIDELSSKQTAEAIEYLAAKVIEGDFNRQDYHLSTPGSEKAFILRVKSNGDTDIQPVTDNTLIADVRSVLSDLRERGWVVTPRETFAEKLLTIF